MAETTYPNGRPWELVHNDGAKSFINTNETTSPENFWTQMQSPGWRVEFRKNPGESSAPGGTVEIVSSQRELNATLKKQLCRMADMYWAQRPGANDNG